MSISDNPILGPEWEPLGQVLSRLLEDVAAGEMLIISTYGRRYNFDPHSSPFVQACANGAGGTQLEIAGNLMVQPQLSSEDYATMEFYGWTLPEVSPENYATEGGNPNFVRYYNPGFSTLEAAEFIVTTLVGVYRFTIEDLFGFDNPDVANFVASLNKLDRLAGGNTNPDRVIFAMPHQHLNMTMTSKPAEAPTELAGPDD